jgi:hypothetical protein
MPASYPAAIPDLPGSTPTPTATATAAEVGGLTHAERHDQVELEVEAIAAELGTNPKGSAASVKARLDALDTTVSGKAATSHTHPAIDISDSTTVGRSLMTAANAAAGRTALGLGTAATAASGDFATAAQGTDDRTASGLRTASTVVSVSSATAPTAGQVLTATSGTAATWQTPGGGGGSVAWGGITGTLSAQTDLQSALDGKVGTSDSRLTDARTPTAHTHTASHIGDSTSIGRSLITATDEAAARTLIGITTFGSNLVGAANEVAGRTVLALGNSSTLDVGNIAGTVAAGDDSRIVGAVQASLTVNTTHSLTGGGNLGANRTLSLVNDTASPGNNKVYGTDGSGVRGWKDDPSGGGGGGTKTLARWGAIDGQPPATGFATLDTRNSVLVLDFDDGAVESVIFVGVIPEAATYTLLMVRLWWAATSAASGNVRWRAEWERTGTDLDANSFDTATEATGSASGTSGIETVTEITCTTIDSIVAGDRFRLRVSRVGTDGTNDTMTGDAELVYVEVRGVT